MRSFAEHCVAIASRLAVGAVILAKVVGKGAGASVVRFVRNLAPVDSQPRGILRLFFVIDDAGDVDLRVALVDYPQLGDVGVGTERSVPCNASVLRISRKPNAEPIVLDDLQFVLVYW